MFFFIIALHILFLISCTRCVLPLPPVRKDSLVFMSYNVQNIFDDTDNGTEYPEFDPSVSEWGISQYSTRLSNLSEVIRRTVKGGADIIAFQEIENRKVLDRLAGNYLKGFGYDYLAVTEAENSAVQIGVMSRYPFDRVMVHQVLSGGKTAGRPILEVYINTDYGTVHLFNNHWKSKLGGAEETEPLRIAAGKMLKTRVIQILKDDPDSVILVAGDLNENWDEYYRIGEAYTTALMPVKDVSLLHSPGPVLLGSMDDTFIYTRGQEELVLYEPWSEEPPGTGTYVYNDLWQTLDHILLSPGLFDETGYEFKSFEISDNSFLLDSRGYPYSWITGRGRGYSDHLPLIVEIELKTP